MAATEIQSTPGLELVHLLSTLSSSIASALHTIPALTDHQRQLRNLLISVLWAPLQQLKRGNTSLRNRQVIGHLRNVATSLENLFSGNLLDTGSDNDQDTWKVCVPL